MSGAEIKITLITGEMLTLGMIDLLLVSQLIKIDRSPAFWWRLIIHDFTVYTPIIFAAVTILAVFDGGDILLTIQKFDWLITIANIFLAIIFKWFVTGKFRRPKDSEAAADQGGSNTAAR